MYIKCCLGSTRRYHIYIYIYLYFLHIYILTSPQSQVALLLVFLFLLGFLLYVSVYSDFKLNSCNFETDFELISCTSKCGLVSCGFGLAAAAAAAAATAAETLVGEESSQHVFLLCFQHP